jgi:NAD/NADP transhydrogenase beta subunit
MTLWLLVALVLVQNLMRTEWFRCTGTLVALAAATFLSGILGKENFVILPIGLTGGLICAASMTRRIKLPGRLVATVLFTFIGAAAVFVERYLARIIRSHPLTLRRHESHSTSGCADMASCGHFAVAVGEVWVSVGG